MGEMFSEKFVDLSIGSMSCYDVRFPTSLNLIGSDAVHTSPDYSCAYVILSVEGSPVKGHGFTFTLGKGTDIVIHAIRNYEYLLRKRKLSEIFYSFGEFWKILASQSQLRWVGPEKGVVHLALAAIINALWDLWAKLENKPVWKLVADMSPEEIVSLVDFTHITDALTKDEALEMLRSCSETKLERERQILSDGVPAYLTSAGWIGYSDEEVTKLCKDALSNGWNAFKMKVGISIADDQRRAKLIRHLIGPERKLMMDANQVWEVDEAINWMHQLAKFSPHWIEEPTNPDDVCGHKAISDALLPLNIGVATGEHCQNRVLFKQFLRSGALQFCQIDACRLGGVNEALAVMLMAAKYNVPVCPHAGGVGLCELMQHLTIINFLCIQPTFENTMIEYAAHLHEHFVNPVQVDHGRYKVPKEAGFSSEMKRNSLESHLYPNGPVWQKLIDSKLHVPTFL